MASVSNYIVSTSFKAKDKISPAYKRMGKNATKFGYDTQRAFRKASTEAGGFKQIMGGMLGAAALQRGLVLTGMAVRSLSEEFISFDQAIISASAKMDGVEKGTKEFIRLEKAARDAGATTEFTATEAAKALNSMAMAGFDLDDAIGALPGTINLATLSEQDLEFATDMSTSALRAFGLMATDIQNPVRRSVKIAENMTRVNDVLAKTLTSSKTNMEELSDALTYGGTATRLAGGDISEFAAIVGTMANANIRGAKAGRAVAQAYTRLSAPPKEAAKMLGKLKIRTMDSNKNLLPLIDILAQIEKKTAKMGNTQKTAAVKHIFGMVAAKGINAAMVDGAAALKNYHGEVTKAGGTSQKMAGTIRRSLRNRLAELKSTLIEVGFKFLDAFSKKFPGAIDQAIEAVRNFDVQSLITNVKILLEKFNKFYTVAKNTVLAIGHSLELYGGWETIKTYAKYVGIAMVAVKAYTAIQWLMNASMSANPVGALIVGLYGLGIALYTIYDSWTFLINSGAEFKRMLDDIMKSPFFYIAIVLNPVLGIIRLIYLNFTKIKVFFENIGEIANTAINWILRGLQKIERYTGILDFLNIKADFGAQEREQKAEFKAARKAIDTERWGKYEGKLLIEGAPAGSTLTEKREGLKHLQLSVALMGQNP